MNPIHHIPKRHPESVAFVFKKYGIKHLPTGQALADAFLKLQHTWFYRDLNNAIIKEQLGHDNFEDEYDYYVVDADQDNFDDGGETVCEFDGWDNMAGSAKRKAKKVKRKAKKATRKANKAAKKSANGVDVPIDNAVMADSGSSDGSAGRTPQEKADLATSIISGLGTAGASIYGAISGNTGQAVDTSGNVIDPTTGQLINPDSGMKQYMPYILGGLALVAVGVIAYIFIKKRKKA